MDMRTAREINGTIDRWRREVLHPLTQIEEFVKHLPRYKQEKQCELAAAYLDAVRVTLNAVWGQEPPEPISHARKTLVLLLYGWERTLVELLKVLDATETEGEPDLRDLVRWQTEANSYYGRYNEEVEQMQLQSAEG